jgi:hypothetical protein
MPILVAWAHLVQGHDPVLAGCMAKRGDETDACFGVYFGWGVCFWKWIYSDRSTGRKTLRLANQSMVLRTSPLSRSGNTWPPRFKRRLGFNSSAQSGIG